MSASISTPRDAFPGQIHDVPAVAPRSWGPRLVVPEPAAVAAPAPVVGIGIDPAEFTEPCPGRVVFGDILLFTEPVTGGSFDRPILLGNRRIMGQVVGDNAGPDRRQHHMAIEVFASDGCEPVEPGTIVRRKAALVSRWSTRRRPWNNEAERQRLLADADEALPDARIARRMPRRGGWR